MPHRPLRLGTRNSALARWQADWVCAQLAGRSIEVELIPITTGGDADQRPIGTIGGIGLFTKEIQRALLDGRVDLAVHSLKDLPTDSLPELTLAAIPPRESPCDALLGRNVASLAEVPAGGRIGTGSQRRRSQLLHCRPDLQVAGIRGNVDTRLKKLDDGEFDAIVLAEAGLNRLGWSDRISELLAPPVMLPAVGQGALGIECRSDDESVRQLLGELDHADTRASVVAERALLALLRGGCSAPIGAWGRVAGSQLALDAVVLSVDGSRRLAASATAATDEAEALAAEVAHSLLEQGAQQLIEAAR